MRKVAAPSAVGFCARTIDLVIRLVHSNIYGAAGILSTFETERF